ncbi:MAG: TonB-dependent receptor [Desulfobacteraceae bacterium]|jgi:outer membrane receptor for ferrienterochelin and colicin
MIFPKKASVCIMVCMFLIGFVSNLYAKDNNVDKIHLMSLEELSQIKINVASKMQENLLSAPGSVYIITDEEIEQYGWRNLHEVLQAIPNIDQLYTYGYAQLGQRGYYGPGNATLLLIDGRDAAFSQYSDVVLTNNTFLTKIVKRIEVLQGPNSTLYGSNALEGVINIVTKVGIDDDEDMEISEINVLAGDAGRRQYEGVFREKKDDYSIGGAFSYFTSLKNWDELGEFAVDHENYSRNTFDALRNTDLSDFRFDDESWSFNLLARWKGLYIGANHQKFLGSYGLEWPFWSFLDNIGNRTVNHSYIGYTYEFGKNSSINLDYTYTDVETLFSLAIDALNNDAETANNFNQPIATSYDDLLLRYRTGGFEIEKHRFKATAKYQLNHKNLFIGGLEYMERKDWLRLGGNVSPGGITYGVPIPEARSPLENRAQRISVFGQDNIQITQKLKAIAGLHYNKEDDLDDKLTPRVSMIYYPTDNYSFEILYGEGFRGPNASENARNTEAGLKPQSMRMIEASYNHFFDIGNILNCSNQMAVYHMEASDKITLTTLPDARIVTTNSDETISIKGVENFLKVKSKKLSGMMGFRYLFPDEILINGEHIEANVPSYTITLGLSYQIMKYLQLSVFLDHRDGVKTESVVYDPTNAYENPQTEVHTVPSYTVIDLNLNIGEFELDGSRTMISLYIENLFNENYYQANWASISPIQYMMPPRNFRCEIAVEF